MFTFSAHVFLNPSGCILNRWSPIRQKELVALLDTTIDTCRPRARMVWCVVPVADVIVSSVRCVPFG